MTWFTDKSSCWSRFWLSVTGHYQMKVQLLPEPDLKMTSLPWLSLLLLLQVNISFQLFQENPEATSLETMKDFLTNDLIIKRFYVVVSLQVGFRNHHKTPPLQVVIFLSLCSSLWAGWLPTRCGNFSIPTLTPSCMETDCLTLFWRTKLVWKMQE